MDYRKNSPLALVALLVALLAAPVDCLASRRAGQVPSVRQLLASLDASSREACSDYQYAPSDVSRRYSVRLIDLDRDGRRDAIIQVYDCRCSPTGNCKLWIFRQTDSGWEPILDTDDVQGFYVRRSQTRGYLDVVTTTHNDAFESECNLFRYDGEQYVGVRCWLRQYRYLDSAGREHLLRKPRYVLGC